MAVILAGGSGGGLSPVIPVPDPTAPTAPGVVVPPRIPRRRVVVGMTVSSPAGSMDLLADDVHVQLDGTSGLTGPDTDVELDELAGVDGAFLRGEDEERAGLILRPLDVILTLMVHGSDGVAAEADVAEIRRILSSRRHGPATLRLTRGDGTTRTLRVHHVPKRGDFDAQWGVNSPSRRVLLRLLAPDPLWRGRPGSAGPFTVGGGTGLALPVALGFSLARSTVIGRVKEIEVLGDEITHPVVSVVGAVGALTATRGEGAQARSYTVAGALLAGEPLVVDHDPRAVLGAGQAVGPAGADWTDRLDDGADLWPLRPGTEAILLDLSEAGGGASVRIDWDTLYWSGVG